MIKNVVIICDYAYIEGGASKVAIQTSLALEKYTSLNVFFVGGCGELCESLKNSGVHAISLQLYDLLGNPNKVDAMIKGIWNRNSAKKLNSILSQLDSQETVVHIHTWTKVLSSSVFKLLHQLRFPVFLTVHDYFLVCPNGGCFNYMANKICELNPMSLRCIKCNCDVRHYYHKIWRCLRQFGQNHVIRKNSEINYIFISEYSKMQLLKRYSGISKQYMLKNPIEFENRYRVNAENNQYFLFIGRLSAEKGVNMFCKAIHDANVKGVVIGDGKLKESLMKQYPNIIFTGWLEKCEIQKWINKGRCLIFPSLWYEGAPLTTLEVQAYGIPCIVSGASAARDNVIENITGLIFDIDSNNSLNSAIIQMKSDDYVRQLSVNTFNQFNEQEYSQKKYVENLCNIYAEIEK